MLLPGLLSTSLLQLLEVPQLGVELVHPVGLGLVGHVVLLQQLAGSLAGAQSLHDLHAAVAPSLGHPVDILLEPVHVWVLGHVGPGLLDRRPNMRHILLKLVDQSLEEKQQTLVDILRAELRVTLGAIMSEPSQT